MLGLSIKAAAAETQSSAEAEMASGAAAVPHIKNNSAHRAIMMGKL